MKTIMTILLTLAIINTAAFAQNRINPRARFSLKKIPYLKVKKGLKHLRMRPLALSRGKVNKRQVLLQSSRMIKLAEFGMSKSVKNDLQKIVVLCAKKTNQTRKIKAQWKNLINKLSKGDNPTDINALIQYVLREAYLETNKDLSFYAEKVKFLNEQKKSLREHLSGLKSSKGKCKNRTSKCSKNTQGEIDREVEKWEQELSSLGDDAQLANIDLQNALQKQQQNLQTMSNISKMLHDTAMAIIRKIG
jgi:hypothetical protein